MTRMHHWLQDGRLFPAAVIPGTPGDDTLTGTSGADTIDGGLGADVMRGGAGADTYIVDNVGDVVVEAAGAGNDGVLASISYTLGDNVEGLRLAGSASLTGTGNALNNVLTGNGGNNILNGLDGNDVMSGLAGKDTLNGGEGNDTLDGGDNLDTISGGNGDDVLRTGKNGGGELNGDAGNDSLYAESVVNDFGGCDLDGGEGNDLLDASAALSDVSLFGGAGNDTLIGGIPSSFAASMTFYGGDGDDLLIVGNHNAPHLDFSPYVNGGAGNDTLQGGTGIDQLAGAEGHDVVSGGGGDDVVYDSDTLADTDTYDGGDGIDEFNIRWTTSSDAVHWVFSSNTHEVRGNTLTGFESIYGYLGSGNDFVDARQSTSAWLWAQDGNDTLIGSDSDADDTRLDGGAGNDSLQGGDGGDALIGGSGSDQVDGGAGDDYIDDMGQMEADTLSGGDGYDTISLYWGWETEGLSYTFSTGPQTFYANTLSGFEALDASGGSGNDYINASASGSAWLEGEDGNDTLIGGNAADTLIGEAGRDEMTGGKGKDQFWLISRGSSDTILDFASGKDTIVVDANSMPVGDKDKTIDGATVIDGPGGFATSAELVIVTADIDGAITAESAAAAIGSATSAYVSNSKRGAVIFAVDNGVDTAIYHFKAAGPTDAIVSAGELALLATLTGTESTTVDDYHWQF